MRHEAPFKFAIRDEGDKGIQVYVTSNEPGIDAGARLVLSMHPRFAEALGVHELLIKFVQDAGRLFIAEVLNINDMSSIEMIERDPPKAN